MQPEDDLLTSQPEKRTINLSFLEKKQTSILGITHTSNNEMDSLKSALDLSLCMVMSLVSAS